MPKPVITFVSQVLRNALLPYIYNTLHMPKPVITFVFQVWSNALLPYFHMPEPVITFVFSSATQRTTSVHSLYTYAQTCDNLRVPSVTQCTAAAHTLQSVKQCIASVHTSHMPNARTYENVRVQSATQCIVRHTHSLSCGNLRVHSATPWTAWAHTFTCPSLW